MHTRVLRKYSLLFFSSDTLIIVVLLPENVIDVHV